MKKKWFEDYYFANDGKNKYLIKIPNSHSDAKQVSFRSIKDARVKWLISHLEAALWDLHKQNEKTNL